MDGTIYRNKLASHDAIYIQRGMKAWVYPLRIGMVLCAVILLYVAYPSTQTTNNVGRRDNSETHASVRSHNFNRSPSNLKIESAINRDYTESGSWLNTFEYPFLDGGDSLLLEPHRDNHVAFSGASPSCGVSWALLRPPQQSDGKDYSQKLLTVLSGSAPPGTVEFIVSPSMTGKFQLSVEQDCTASSATRTVWVKYVRRELSSLTAEDREEFLDAFSTLWKVDTVTGRERYGQRYKSAYYLSTVHNDAAGNMYCDEFHGGPGFLSNHVYIGNYLEQSMQTVNPRVALHYMDYTKYYESVDFDAHMHNMMDGGTWTELMTAKWFGANDPITGRIISGRWANTVIPRLTEEFFVAHGIPQDECFFPTDSAGIKSTGNGKPHASGNPYGLLRSPWEFAPQQYLLRFNNVGRISNDLLGEYDVEAQKLAGVKSPMSASSIFAEYLGVFCDAYSAYIQDEVVGKTLEAVMSSMETQIHGFAHFATAGAGGEHSYKVEQELRSRFKLDDAEINYIVGSSQIYQKSQMQRDVISAVDMTFLKPWSCENLNLFQGGKLTTNALPGERGGPHCEVNEYYLRNDSTLNEFIAGFYTAGPAGIDFPANLMALPTADKLDLVKMLGQKYQFDGDLATSAGSVDPIFWVLHGSLERLYQRVIFEDVLSDMSYTSSNACSGHDAMSTKQWLKGYFFQDETILTHTLTNQQLTDFLNPKSDAFAYLFNFVYDTRTYDWCPGFDAAFQQQ